jgi:hypothetical protein
MGFTKIWRPWVGSKKSIEKLVMSWWRLLRLEPVSGGSLFFEERGSVEMAGYMKLWLAVLSKSKEPGLTPDQQFSRIE